MTDATAPYRAYRWCVECGLLLGKTSYSFGTRTPLCEVCMDRLERKSVDRYRAEHGSGKTWAEWLLSMARWK